MGLPSMEDILRHRFSGTKPRLLPIPCFSYDVLWKINKFSALDFVSKHNMVTKKFGSLQRFYADIQTSFSALFDRSLLDSLEFLHSPSSGR